MAETPDSTGEIAMVEAKGQQFEAPTQAEQQGPDGHGKAAEAPATNGQPEAAQGKQEAKPDDRGPLEKLFEETLAALAARKEAAESEAGVETVYADFDAIEGALRKLASELDKSGEAPASEEVRALFGKLGEICGTLKTKLSAEVIEAFVDEIQSALNENNTAEYAQMEKLNEAIKNLMNAQGVQFSQANTKLQTESNTMNLIKRTGVLLKMLEPLAEGAKALRNKKLAGEREEALDQVIKRLNKGPLLLESIMHADRIGENFVKSDKQLGALESRMADVKKNVETALADAWRELDRTEGRLQGEINKTRINFDKLSHSISAALEIICRNDNENVIITAISSLEEDANKLWELSEPIDTFLKDVLDLIITISNKLDVLDPEENLALRNLVAELKKDKTVDFQKGYEKGKAEGLSEARDAGAKDAAEAKAAIDRQIKELTDQVKSLTAERNAERARADAAEARAAKLENDLAEANEAV